MALDSSQIGTHAIGMIKELYDFNDYREYLKDIWETRRKQDPKLTYRQLAKDAGFRSSNFFHLILTGKRNIQKDSCEKLSKYFGHDSQQAKYFYLLSQLNQAETEAEKFEFAEQILKIKRYRERYPLAEAQLKYYQHWYYVAIRELVSLASFVEDPNWIAKQLGGSVKPSEAKQAIEELLTLGLLKRTDGGRLKTASAHVRTQDKVTSLFLRGFHKSMIQKGADAIESLPPHQRDITSVTLTFQFEKLDQIKALVQKFRQEIIGLAEQAGGANSVVQMNIQVFPLTLVSEEKDEHRPKSQS